MERPSGETHTLLAGNVHVNWLWYKSKTPPTEGSSERESYKKFVENILNKQFSLRNEYITEFKLS